MKAPAAFLLLFVLSIAAQALAAPAPTAQSFESNGVSIQYTVEGNGPPVVLIHGLHANADINWRLPGVIKALTPKYQVIAMDVRGHGHSAKPEQEGAYGVEMVEDVVRLLDHLKIKKAHVVGYSMGGMITMKLMTRHPDRIESAILGGMGWMRQGSVLQDFWTVVPVRQGFSTPAACIRSLGALAVKEDELNAIRIPVEVIIGQRDPVRRLYVAPLEQARKDWPVKVIDGAGHLNCIFMPQFGEEIKNWLDRQGK
jgi:pimeloyl-ACP methyl ester carboxylesterase